jgi:hypothetical protein
MARRTCLNTVTWLVTSRSLTEIYQDFGGKYSYTLEMEEKLSSKNDKFLALHGFSCWTVVFLFMETGSGRPLTKIYSIHFINSQGFRVVSSKDELSR